jgi:hypothetical protein
VFENLLRKEDQGARIKDSSISHLERRLVEFVRFIALMILVEDVAFTITG